MVRHVSINLDIGDFMTLLAGGRVDKGEVTVYPRWFPKHDRERIREGLALAGCALLEQMAKPTTRKELPDPMASGEVELEQLIALASEKMKLLNSRFGNNEEFTRNYVRTIAGNALGGRVVVRFKDLDADERRKVYDALMLFDYGAAGATRDG